MASGANRNRPSFSSLLVGCKSLLGVGLYLLLLGLVIEGLTAIMRQRIAFPVSPSSELQLLLTVLCVAGCLSGVIWFNRTLNLFRIHLLHGKNELMTGGPFTFVRHPLYATLMLTIPPLFIIWFSDLLFFVPWLLIIVVVHLVVRLEERGLVATFGPEYERYRRYVPALLPYKGNGGKRYRAER